MLIYKSIRQKNGWTQRDLAKRIGVPASVVRQNERENIVPRLSYTRSFMSIFNLSWGDLNAGADVSGSDKKLHD